MIALAAAGCGGSSSHAAAGASRGDFPVTVTARFPAAQRLAQPIQLVIAVRNRGHRALPDVAVTICNVSCAPSDRPDQGTSAQAFGTDVSGTDLADPSRPIWIVNRGPGACDARCDTAGGQAGAGVTANSNTWALGSLAPGATARFTWSLTAVSAGRHVVAWQVAGNLSGTARATTGSGPGTGSGGAIPHGTFTVRVSAQPQSTYVTPSGQVVTTPQ